MHQQWEYLTVTISRNRDGDSVGLVNGESSGYLVIGHGISKGIQELGKAGWELVTSYASVNGTPNLVFKRQAEKQS